MSLLNELAAGSYQSRRWSGSQSLHAGRDDLIIIDGLGSLVGATFQCTIRDFYTSDNAIIEPVVTVVDAVTGVIKIDVDRTQTILLKDKVKVWMVVDVTVGGEVRNFYEGEINVSPEGADLSVLPANTSVETLTDQLVTKINDFESNYGSSFNTILASNDVSLDSLQEIVDFVKSNRSDLDTILAAANNSKSLLGQINSAIFAVNTANSGVWMATLWSNPQASYWQSRGNSGWPKVYGVDRPFALIPANTPLNEIAFTMSCGGSDVQTIEIALCVAQSNNNSFADVDIALISDTGTNAPFDFSKKISVTPQDSKNLFGGKADLGGVTFSKDAMAFLCVRYTGTASANVSAPFTVMLR